MERFQSPKEIHHVGKTSMEPPLEKGVVRKRYITKDENIAMERKVATAVEKIIKSKINDEVVNHELKDHIKQLENVKEEQRATIYNQLKKINELEGEIRNEARLRGELATKVSNTRDICVTLENYMKDLVSTVNTCQNDRKTLSDCYQKAVQAFSKIRAEQLETEEKFTKQMESLQRELGVEKKSKAESMQSWSDTKKTLDDIVNHLKDQCVAQSKDIKYYIHEKEAREKNVNTAMAEIAKLNEDLKQWKQTASSLEGQIMEYKKIIDESEKSVLKSEAEMKNVFDDKLNVEKELHSSNAIMKRMKIRSDELENELDIMKKEMEKKGADFDKQISQQMKINSDNEITIKKCTDENNSLKVKIIECAELLKTKEAQWEKERSDHLSNVEKDNTKNAEMKQMYETNESKLKSLEEKLREQEKIKEENILKVSMLEEDFRNNSNSLMAQIKTYRDQLNNSTKSNDDLVKEKELLKGELLILKNYATNKNHEISDLTAEMKNLELKLNAKSKECDEKIDFSVSGTIKPTCESKSIQTVANKSDNIFDSLLPINANPEEKIYNELTPVMKSLKRKNVYDYTYDVLSDSSFEGITLDPTNMNNYMKSLADGIKDTSSLQLVPTKKSKKSYIPKKQVNGGTTESAIFTKPQDVKTKNSSVVKKRIFSTKKKPAAKKKF